MCSFHHLVHHKRETIDLTFTYFLASSRTAFELYTMKMYKYIVHTSKKPYSKFNDNAL